MVTFSRYITLIVYGVITYFLFSILSSITSIQTLWYNWANLLHKTFNTSNFAPLYGYVTLLFLAGLAVNKIADSFSIYNSKRYWQFNWRYPSLMISVTWTITIWLFFESKTASILFSLDLVSIYLPLLSGLTLLPALEFLKVRITQKITPLCIDDPKNNASTRHIAKQIQETLCDEKNQAKSKRILICGPFGVGKTTAINLAIGKLKSKKEWPKLVHCNVDLWGVEAESIIQYVLDEVLIALSTEIDMCRFRSLPSHYISAMNAGNTSSKIFAAFMHKPKSPDALLKSLSDVINAANLRLLVTIQDLDRNQKALDSLHVLAGLLDRLEELQGIDYIFAGENRPEFSDTLLRICPIRFDFSVPDLTDDITKLADGLIDENLQKYYKDVLPNSEVKKCPELVDLLLPSFRDFESLSSQVKSSWENIKGEVLLYDFILIQALKNNQPKFHDTLYQILLGEISTKGLRVNAFINEHFSDCTPQLKVIIEGTLIHLGLIELYDVMPDEDNETLGRIISLKNITNHLLSINSERIYSILFSGFLDNNTLKKMKVYKSFTKIVQGDKDSVGVLCNGFKDVNARRVWADSLNSYGWVMLHNQLEDINIAKLLIHSAIKFDETEGSKDLLDSLVIRKNMFMNPRSGLKSYLFSEDAIVDLLELRRHLNHDTFFIVCFIYMSFRHTHRFHDNERIDVSKSLNSIINSFLNSDSKGQVILLLFCHNVGSVKDILALLDKSTLTLLSGLFSNMEFEAIYLEYAATISAMYDSSYKKTVYYEERFIQDKKEALAVVNGVLSTKT
ncbi:KAP family NTPase [Pseudoalteromonas agarivorans]|uniref:P-loop NTPase fold protein n=1 Tax=Pseudoalteromonas agarivorans TaxID=176102 RepID=UPI002118F843|nr:P-loop NTPase fold protein [Pseudoalteromonas agarivorans]MCQ8821612.1 KAP family NTPase [Pseudoalteromonas agarivorans]